MRRVNLSYQKHTIVLFLALVSFAFIFTLAYRVLLSDSALGIDIDGSTLEAGLGPLENLEYRFLIREASSGDSKAITNLVAVHCGGGAGCYDHGAVLVHVMQSSGDRIFSNAVSTLDLSGKNDLHSLLTAGIEYGPNGSRNLDMKANFPMTADVLRF